MLWTLRVLKSPECFRRAAGQNNNHRLFTAHTEKCSIMAAELFPKDERWCTNAPRMTLHTNSSVSFTHTRERLALHLKAENQSNLIRSWLASLYPTPTFILILLSSHSSLVSSYCILFISLWFHIVRHSGHVLGRGDDVTVFVRVQDLGKVTGHRVCILSDVNLRERI